MKDQHKDVASAAADLAGAPEVKEQVQALVNESRLVNALISMRLQSGLSQTEVAEKMGCSQPKIAKIEGGTDLSLKWGDVAGYISALDMRMHVAFEQENLPAATRIKMHVMQVHKLLEELACLAKEVDDDTSIVSKIHEFYGEVLFNFMMKFSQSYQTLQANAGLEDDPVVELSLPDFASNNLCECCG